MARTNFTAPEYVNRAYEIAEQSENSNQIARELHRMTDRHNNLLRSLHSLVDSYNQLLDAHGPYHEVELGESTARLEDLLRRALNDSQ